MAEHVHILGGNGEVILHDLPLPVGLIDRIAHGDVTIVNADGSPISTRAASKPKAARAASTED